MHSGLKTSDAKLKSSITCKISPYTCLILIPSPKLCFYPTLRCHQRPWVGGGRKKQVDDKIDESARISYAQDWP